MEGSVEKFEARMPQGWGKLIGTLIRASDLDETTRATSGLIVLETASGTEACPVFQFDKDENGHDRVNPHVGLAWSLITALHIDQLGRGSWTEAGWLAQSRPEHDNRSWAEVLKDPLVTDKDKLPIYAQIVGDAVDMAAWNGDPLIDPRTLLRK
jgi:hypothetical protein